MRNIWVISDYLRYDDGDLFWIKSDNPNIIIGDKAGCTRHDGYKIVRFKGVNYLAHRIIWFLFYGEWPPTIDHIDRDPSNNRIGNLRAASKRLNSLNRDAPKNSKSGKAGVSWDSSQCKWAVRWKEKSGKYSFLGYFKDLDDAIKVRTLKEKEVQDGM